MQHCCGFKMNQLTKDHGHLLHLLPQAFVAHEELNGRSLRRVSRRATASPATGNHHLHEEEEKALMTEAFTR